MRNYKLSWILASLLFAGAFIAQYAENKKPLKEKNDTMPWVLFCGGMILGLVGYREYRSNLEDRQKDKK